MKIEGRITKLLPDGLAEVLAEPNPACPDPPAGRAGPIGACLKCKGCQMFESKGIILKARNEPGAKAGDKVEVEIEEAEGIKAALMIFIFPVVSLILGYYIGRGVLNSEIGGIISAFIGLAAAFIFLNLLDRRLKKQNDCRIAVTKIY